MEKTVLQQRVSLCKDHYLDTQIPTCRTDLIELKDLDTATSSPWEVMDLPGQNFVNTRQGVMRIQ